MAVIHNHVSTGSEKIKHRRSIYITTLRFTTNVVSIKGLVRGSWDKNVFFFFFFLFYFFLFYFFYFLSSFFFFFLIFILTHLVRHSFRFGECYFAIVLPSARLNCLFPNFPHPPSSFLPRK